MSNTVLNPTPNATVVLRGISIPLSSDVGGAFLSDCARNRERIFSDEQICEKYGIEPNAWAEIIQNKAVRLAVNAEHERRIRNGDAARESAAKLFAEAPTVLGKILNDERSSPRHRIEAAKELRATANTGAEKPAIPPTGLSSPSTSAAIKNWFLISKSRRCHPTKQRRASMPSNETYSFADDTAPEPEIKQPHNDAQKLLDFLQRWPENTVTVRDFRVWGPRIFRDKRKAISTAEILVEFGWLIPTKPHWPGTYAWQVVRKPIVHPAVDM